MIHIHLKTIYNGINDSMLEAIDLLASESVTRDEHNFWFDTDASQQEIDAVCQTFGLVRVD